MSNRRRPKHPPAAPPNLLRVGLVIDPDDPIDTTVQAVFKLPTFGDLADAAEAGEAGSIAYRAAIAERTYLRTETMAGEDLELPWDEMQGVLAGPDVIGRIQGREEPSQLHRALREVARFCGLPWDAG